MGQPWRNDTWILENGLWRKGPAAPSGLKARGGAAMAYHPGIQKVVLFGGAGPGWPPYHDTWLYDGSSWTKGPTAPSGLTGRTGARMAYHDGLGELVLFGGSGVKPYNETWLFDGTRWAKGPATPAGMSARVFFGMTYNPATKKIMVAGGNGQADTWLFDGVSWAAGPNLAPELAGIERINLTYDPQLGGVMLFGGMGASASQGAFFILRGSSWFEIQKDPDNQIVPGKRLDAAVTWMPDMDAFMLFAGVSDDGKDDSSGYRDTWYFRDVAPQVASVDVSPKAPTIFQSVALVTGSVQGGYRADFYEYSWFINGVQVAGAKEKRLMPSTPGYIQGAQIQAKVRVHDYLGIYGPWVGSNVITVANQLPTMKACDISPANPDPLDTLSADHRAGDPDNDPIVFHFAWTVNGTAVANNDLPVLTPDKTKNGDRIGLTCWAVDAFGGKSATMTATSRTIQN